METREPKVKDFQIALADSPVTVFFLCSEGRFIWFENAQSFWISDDMIGKAQSSVFDEKSSTEMTDAFNKSTGPDDPKTVLVRTKNEPDSGFNARTLKIILRRVLDDEGKPKGALCSTIDITQEIETAETQRLLLMEVAHRSKNMLSMVLSLAAQTARASNHIDVFMRRFTGRLQSMAKSQDAITAADWGGVRWRQLVDEQVQSVVPMGLARVSLSGVDLTLSPNGATHMGLALHELVTHSLSSGALSVEDGRVEIDMRIVATHNGPFAVMRWVESGTLQKTTDEIHDDRFSKALLTQLVPAALSGEAVLNSENDVVEYELSVGTQDYKRAT